MFLSVSSIEKYGHAEDDEECNSDNSCYCCVRGGTGRRIRS